MGVAWSGGCHAPLPQKTLKKKVNLKELSQVAKFFFFDLIFNILTELLLVQKQTIHQQKAWDLSYLETEGKGRGMVRRVPRPLSAKDIEKKSKFDGAKSGRKKKFF